jgi:hypothetical protein
VSTITIEDFNEMLAKLPTLTPSTSRWQISPEAVQAIREAKAWRKRVAEHLRTMRGNGTPNRVVRRVLRRLGYSRYF